MVVENKGDIERQFLKDLDELENIVITEAKKELTKASHFSRNEAVKNAPVDTGRLKGSIQVDKVSVDKHNVGTNVEYAMAVEFGTSKQGAQPFLRPAVIKGVAKLKEGIDTIIDKALKSVFG